MHPLNVTTINSRILLVASLLLLPTVSPLLAATTFHDFNSDPNISGAWTNDVYFTNTGTATWNGSTALNLAHSTGDRWSMLSPNGGTRGASDTVTIDITAATHSGIADWDVVGLAISDNANVNLTGDTSPMYRFHLRNDTNTNTWYYQVARGSNTSLFSSSTFAFSSPITLSIERNGANYLFKANGSTVYTGSAYTSAEHDAMDYYHITWGNGSAASSMTATVDNFGVIPEPSTPFLGGLGLLVLLRRRR